MYDQTADGRWRQRQVVNKFGRDAYLYNLVAISPHAVAWEQENEIWTQDFNTGEEVEIWPANGTLYRFAYDDHTGDLLLDRRDARGPFTLRLQLPHSGKSQGAVLDTYRDGTSTPAATLHIEKGIYFFMIPKGPNADLVRFDWDGMVEDYQLAGNFLYFVGNHPEEIPGIWQLDLRTKSVSPLIPSQQRPFHQIQPVNPVVGTATTAKGRTISYHLWKPRQVAAGLKYPLIIGQTHYIWSPYQQVAPAAGYFFATADRATWASDIDNWPEDVQALHDVLTRDPAVDTNRNFLTAFSAESEDVVQVLSASPGLCHGAILFNPVAEPDIEQSHLASMFIVGGQDDATANNLQELTLYQQMAAKAGIPVNLLIQDGVQHIARSVATERERTRQFARFLIGN